MGKVMNLIRLIQGQGRSQCFQEAEGEYVMISPHQPDVARRLGRSFEAEIVDVNPVIVSGHDGRMCYTYNSPAWKLIEKSDRAIRRVELTLQLPCGTRATLQVPPRCYMSLFGRHDGLMVFKVQHLSTSRFSWYQAWICRPPCPVCRDRKKLTLFGRYRKCPKCCNS